MSDVENYQKIVEKQIFLINTLDKYLEENYDSQTALMQTLKDYAEKYHSNKNNYDENNFPGVILQPQIHKEL